MQTDIKNIINFMKMAENLKMESRDTLLNNDENEKVSDHCFSMALLTILLKNKIEENCDYTKVLEMAILHDLPEAKAGDISLYLQDEETKKRKTELELKAINDISLLLPNKTKERIKEIWMEFEEGKTKESRLAKLLDCFDVLIQVINHYDFTYCSKYGDGKFYYNHYANLNPTKKLGINDKFLIEIENYIRENLIKQMDDKGIKYKIEK